MRARVAYWYMLASLVLAACYVTQSGAAADGLQGSVNIMTAAAVIIGMRRNRTNRPRAWRLFASGLLALGVEESVGIVNIIHPFALADPVGNLLELVGYVGLIAGGVVALSARGRRDVGGVLDAAVLSVATTSVIWEFLLFGKLTAFHTTTPVLVVILIQLLTVMAGLGVLLRLTRTSPGLPTAVWFLFGTAGGGFVQIVIFTVVTTNNLHVPGSPLDSVGLVAAACTGAAALHPSMSRLTEPGPVIADRLSMLRLLMLGLALMTAPISVGVWQLLGHRADSVLIVVGSVAIVPLVMFRIRGLVTQRATAEAALAHQATHDSLTGLPNRAQFINQLDAALHRVRTGSAAEIAVLFCDLNGFKHVNDTLGHGVGDHLLIAVAQRLQHCIREPDTVSRFGGDEFLILCESSTETNIAEQVATRITSQLQHPITIGTNEITIGASIGIAATTTAGDLTADEIIRDADLAMYTAKQAVTS